MHASHRSMRDAEIQISSDGEQLISVTRSVSAEYVFAHEACMQNILLAMLQHDQAQESMQYSILIWVVNSR